MALNRISAESFFGGRRRLDREAALRAIEEKIVAPLGFDVFSAAKGILDIVDARMADLIRKLTVERGFDPRDFVLLSYGGAGPAHAGAYSREVGVARALVSPYSRRSQLWDCFFRRRAPLFEIGADAAAVFCRWN